MGGCWSGCGPSTPPPGCPPRSVPARDPHRRGPGPGGRAGRGRATLIARPGVHTTAMTDSPRLSQPVSARDHARGPETAPVTLVEYGDFECPHCGAAYPVVAELER